MFPYFTVFGKVFFSYQLLAAAGAIVAGVAANYAARWRGLNTTEMLTLLLVSAIGVLLGGHLLYALTQFRRWGELLTSFAVIRDIFGGSIFYGGLLGGLCAASIYMRHRRFFRETPSRIAEFTDAAAPSIPLFHTFGRLGCFLSGCCYGVESRFGFTFRRSLVTEANGVRRLPTALIEMVFCLILSVILRLINIRGKAKGRVLDIYLVCYAVFRFFIEFWRGDEIRGFIFGLSTSQWISLLILGFCLLRHIYLKTVVGKNQTA